MMRGILSIGFLCAFLLVGCQFPFTEGTGKCPDWSHSEGQCYLGLWKYSITSHQTVDFSRWSAIRFTIINGDLTMDNVVNIEFKTEHGDLINVTSTRLSPGTYFAYKIDSSQPSHFTISSSAGIEVTLSGELVLFQ